MKNTAQYSWTNILPEGLASLGKASTLDPIWKQRKPKSDLAFHCRSQPYSTTQQLEILSTSSWSELFILNNRRSVFPNCPFVLIISLHARTQSVNNADSTQCTKNQQPTNCFCSVCQTPVQHRDHQFPCLFAPRKIWRLLITQTTHWLAFANGRNLSTRPTRETQTTTTSQCCLPGQCVNNNRVITPASEQSNPGFVL